MDVRAILKKDFKGERETESQGKDIEREREREREREVWERFGCNLQSQKRVRKKRW